jgi:hypothetical protein
MKQLSLFPLEPLTVKKHRPNREERLQALWDILCAEGSEAHIEFRPLKGWYAAYPERRHFTDEGEYLGENWRAAEKTIRYIWKGERYR